MDRKEDTRKKIRLGGVVLKSKVPFIKPPDAYILYGMLLDCRRALELKPELKKHWAILGKELLLSNQN